MVQNVKQRFEAALPEKPRKRMNKGIQFKVALEDSLGLSSLVDDGLVDALRLPEQLHRYGSLKAHQREAREEEQQAKALAREKRKTWQSSTLTSKDLG